MHILAGHTLFESIKISAFSILITLYLFDIFLYSWKLSGEFPMDCPLHDSLLRVHYKGMLFDEEMTVFYDTRVENHGEPLEFSSGEGFVSI